MTQYDLVNPEVTVIRSGSLFWYWELKYSRAPLGHSPGTPPPPDSPIGGFVTGVSLTRKGAVRAATKTWSKTGTENKSRFSFKL